MHFEQFNFGFIAQFDIIDKWMEQFIGFIESKDTTG